MEKPIGQDTFTSLSKSAPKQAVTKKQTIGEDIKTPSSKGLKRSETPKIKPMIVPVSYRDLGPTALVSSTPLRNSVKVKSTPFEDEISLPSIDQIDKLQESIKKKSQSVQDTEVSKSDGFGLSKFFSRFQFGTI